MIILKYTEEEKLSQTSFICAMPVFNPPPAVTLMPSEDPLFQIPPARPFSRGLQVTPFPLGK